MSSYNTSKGKTVTIGAELGKGGEGRVYELARDHQSVAKIYHPTHRTSEREQKLRVMVANPPQDDTRKLPTPHVSIAWPVELLYERKQFAGFVMPRINQSPDIFQIYNPQVRTKNNSGFDWRYLHRTAYNLATAMNALHMRGYVMGDVNQKNILVTNAAMVTLVDTDSFQVRNEANGEIYRCPVGVPEYTPPELQKQRLDAVDRHRYHDAFGIAVIIFQLLMEGYHPFTGAPKDPTLSLFGEIYLHCIRQGIFPYQPNESFSPPPGAPQFAALYPEAQELFQRCFVVGHRNPTARPTARQWLDTLGRAEKELVPCDQNPAHWYSQHYGQCPWCEREQQRPIPVQQGLPPLVPSIPPQVTPIAPIPPRPQVQPVAPLSPAHRFPTAPVVNPPVSRPNRRLRTGVMGGIAVLVVLVLGLLWLGIPTSEGTTTRVSIASDGSQGNGASGLPSISGDGRYVAFWSEASNLVPDDTNGRRDIFVHDQQTGQTSRVSISSDGTQGNWESTRPSISADGRYVAFDSRANNLVSSGTWEFSTRDVFVHDRQTGQTSRVSVASDGSQGNGQSFSASISADGRYVAFWSEASNLVPDDTNGSEDVFVHDQQTGQTNRVSIASDGSQGNDGSGHPSISADGRYVAFYSFASNLVPGDTNDTRDVFVHDRQTGQTSRVSIASDGSQGNGQSSSASISDDGRYVAFDSRANNLVPNDTNGSEDVFVHDRQTGQTSRVSIASDGSQGNGQSFFPLSISGDGRYVVFRSFAQSLAPGGRAANYIFVHDRQTGQTSHVSIASDGPQGLNYSLSISADGRYVAFTSNARDLVRSDTNDLEDVFVHDR